MAPVGVIVFTGVSDGESRANRDGVGIPFRVPRPVLDNHRWEDERIRVNCIDSESGSPHIVLIIPSVPRRVAPPFEARSLGRDHLRADGGEDREADADPDGQVKDEEDFRRLVPWEQVAVADRRRRGDGEVRRIDPVPSFLKMHEQGTHDDETHEDNHS